MISSIGEENLFCYGWLKYRRAGCQLYRLAAKSRAAGSFGAEICLVSRILNNRLPAGGGGGIGWRMTVSAGWPLCFGWLVMAAEAGWHQPGVAIFICTGFG
jgi:hypothetical protein